jgi:hypothetical protein
MNIDCGGYLSVFMLVTTNTQICIYRKDHTTTYYKTQNQQQLLIIKKSCITKRNKEQPTEVHAFKMWKDFIGSMWLVDFIVDT